MNTVLRLGPRPACDHRKFRRPLWFSCARFLFFLALVAVSSANSFAALNFPANKPVGTAMGINPGRVVWVHNTNAVSWDGQANYWWSDQYTSQSKVDTMVSTALQRLTGQTTDAKAWSALFKYFNGGTGYSPTEVVALKIDMSNQPGDTQNNNKNDATPDMVLSMVKELVTQAGVPSTNIIVYDASARIGNTIVNKIFALYTNITFLQKDVGNAQNGRVAANWVQAINFSNPNIPSSSSACLMPSQITTNVNYMINLALLKQQSWGALTFPTDGNAPLTLCGENQFGALQGYTNLYPFIRPTNGAKAYNPIVDVMGSQYLGAKTILYMQDGLYGAVRYDSWPSNYSRAPFNNWWPACVLASQDPVAIDSVGLDILNNFSPKTLWTNADEYLLEAAQADNPPSGTIYQPDGFQISSLGAAEHWNNATAWQYSRDLGTGNGIQLVKVDLSANVQVVITSPANNASVPRDLPVPVTATASSSFAAITNVAFYLGTNFLGNSTLAPFHATWTNAQPGDWTLKAIATDANGISGTSAVVNVTVTLLNYQLFVSPPVASVLVGSNAIFTVAATTSSSFTGTVALASSGLPSDITATFNPVNISGTNSSILTVSTANSTLPGTYPFMVIGTDGDLIAYADASLIVTNIPSNPGPLLWTKGSGSDTNWFTRYNWTNPIAGGLGPPTTYNDVFFGNRKNDKTIAPPGVINNVVDGDVEINSLNYTNANGAHTTLIPDFTTLTIYNTNGLIGLTVGAGGNPTVLAAETNSITGTNGTLALYGDLLVSQGASQADAHNVTFDLSGLGTFEIPGYETLYYILIDPTNYIYEYYYVTMPEFSMSVGQSVAFDGSTNTAPCGTLILAQDNELALTQLAIGNNSTTNVPLTRSAVFLGQTNFIVADDVEVGMVNCGSALLAFQPGLTNPVAILQGPDYEDEIYLTNLYTVPITSWGIADNGGTAAASLFATNDFTGGNVTILATTLRVGRGSANSTKFAGTGVLTFDNGVVSAIQVNVGEQATTSGGPGIGTINVGTNATLSASALWLTYGAVSATPSNTATLNVNGGIVNAGIINKVGGIATLNLNSGGTLNLTNTLGKPAGLVGAITMTNSALVLLQSGAPSVYVTNFFATNAAIHLNLDALNPATNMVIRNFIARGTNVVVIDALANFEGPAVFPIATYSTLNGSISTNFALGNVPAGLTALLINDTTHKTIYLSIAPTDSVNPQISSVTVSGSSFLISASGGLPASPGYVLQATNLAQPLSSWTLVSTNYFDINGNFVFTNQIDGSSRQRFFLMQTP